ncbi:MAG: NAD synthetase [Desulfobulbaceae bacterium BRH_c16a]|nr:MAG: NAD synthetase [Desulfobulbaceae bacterium BRH_c16a]
MVQINPVIGDFDRNCEKIRLWSEKARTRGCDLVIFPELVVSGYPPQDLLERNSFLAAHDEAVASLLAHLPEIDTMFGCLERRDGRRGKPLHNSSAVARQGRVIFRARKQLLPAYDVFDESRYFEPGSPSDFYQVKGLTFGVTVCEDVWSEEVNEYDVDPVADIFSKAKAQGVTIDGIINISASPFQRDKEKIRKGIFEKICRSNNVPFFYCNQVGGQDSLLFDGRSLVMDATGTVVAQAKGFCEDMIVVDTDTWQGDMNEAVRISEQAAVYQGLVMGVSDYCRKCGFSSVVLGLSGGIDSALTAAVAVDALGPENVLGVALPSPYSSADSLEDAGMLAANLGCRFEVIPIAELFDTFRRNMARLFAGREEDLTEQNLQARIRGNLLMALSNKFGHLLLTTGNKSEMAVGYCTLYGDMSGGLAVISDVPKQLVYELAEYVNRTREIIPARTIAKAPTAELKPGQKDQDDLPPYEVLDRILELYLEQGKGITEIVELGFAEPLVRDILRRIRLNEYKRKQAPMGLKVTTKAFGYGRRYPNVQNFQG